jgi:type II secretory pathway component PulK
VIWVCLGLVALTVYFADSMISELRAAENRAAGIEAQQAVTAGTRYAAYILSQFGTGGAVPQFDDYNSDAMPVGDATFWFIGRDPDDDSPTEPHFGIVDEASKLNLNTATRAMLEALPNMTPELVEGILAWRRRAGEAAGLAADMYGRLDPPRQNKSAPFETVDELRLVYGATLDVLFGEDANRNGALDPNEDDGDQLPPRDDQNGHLLAGVAEYVTVYTRHPVRRGDGGRRVNISNLSNQPAQAALFQLLQRRLEPGRAADVMVRAGTRTFGSVAEFMWDSGLTAEEYAGIHADLTTSDRPVSGLINVNTAPEAVLACIPGIGFDLAPTLVAYRMAHPDALTSFAWLREVLPRANVVRAGPYITDHSYQFSVDVAAVGRFGRGYARARTIFDMSNGFPRIVYHQDLTHHGWALGSSVRHGLRRDREDGT